MKKIALAFLFLATTAFAAPKPVMVDLMDSTGKKIGAAKITKAKKGVKVHVEVAGLSAGDHAIHFHEKGVCTGPDFKSAGGHFNPTKKEHGFDNPNGPHEGDMRNFTVAADGTAKADVTDERVSLTPDSLLQPGGTSLVIHAKPDDYKSQPAGNAGDRVACGVIGA